MKKGDERVCLDYCPNCSRAHIDWVDDMPCAEGCQLIYRGICYACGCEFNEVFSYNKTIVTKAGKVQ